jgi:xanthine dehydrogenase YagR molybdenum-binding subunit
MSMGFIGASVTRVDGRAKVTGAARYAADFNQPNQLYAVIVSVTLWGPRKNDSAIPLIFLDRAF